MHFTRKEFIDYILHVQPKVERKEAEKKADKFLRFVAKRRKLNDLPVFTREDIKPKQKKGIQWKKKNLSLSETIQELKEIESSLSRL